MQKLEYRDWLFTCDHCGSKRHCHKFCAREKARKGGEVPATASWAQKVRHSPADVGAMDERAVGKPTGPGPQSSVAAALTHKQAYQADQKA